MCLQGLIRMESARNYTQTRHFARVHRSSSYSGLLGIRRTEWARIGPFPELSEILGRIKFITNNLEDGNSGRRSGVYLR